MREESARAIAVHAPRSRRPRLLRAAVLLVGFPALGLCAAFRGARDDCRPPRLIAARADDANVPAERGATDLCADIEAGPLETSSAAIRWTFRLTTLQREVLFEREGQSLLAGGTGVACCRFEGADRLGRVLAPGRYVYRFDAPGFVSTGGFLTLGDPCAMPPARVPDAAAPAAVPVNPSVPYNYYFGAAHAHTAYTDGGIPTASCTGAVNGYPGGATPTEAYLQAASQGQVSWFALTDHNHLFDDACAGCAASALVARYRDGLAAAQAATTADFVGIYGMEWGTISGGGHVALYDVPQLFGWEPYAEVQTPETDYLALYAAASDPANQGPYGSAGAFCHPGTGDFNGFARSAAGLSVVSGLAVISGPYNASGTAFADAGTRYAGPKAFTDVYQFALQRGWRIGPEAHPDAHCWNYGTSTRNRTVLLAPALTKAALMEAMRRRRFYAASDMNAQVFFGTADYAHVMGESFQSGAAALDLLLWVHDPDGSPVATVDLYEGNPSAGGGAPVRLGMASSGPETYGASVPVPASGESYFYAYVTLANGAEIWTAPLWISSCAAAGPPSSVGDTLRGARGSAQADFTWSAPPSPAVAAYRLYGASVLAGAFPQGWTSLATGFSTGASDPLGSAYRYYLVASRDACGHESAANGGQACAPAAAALSVAPAPSVALGTPQTFTASGSGQGALAFDWDFRYDGASFHAMASGPAAGYTYPSAGAFTAALRVTDSCDGPGPQTALAVAAVGVTAAATGCTELFFSEYVEGTGYHKAVEIYNPSPAPVDLGARGYAVELYRNGSATAGSKIGLYGAIPSKGVFVLCHPSASFAAQPYVNLTSSALDFNGDDAVVLARADGPVDVLGQIGTDPGTQWGTGSVTTLDHTLRRKSAVAAGDPNGSDPFDPALEWDGYPKDTIAGLGAHASACP